MRHPVRLTPEDRQAISRWWRVMMCAVVIFAVGVLAVEKSYQKIFSQPPQVAEAAGR